MKLQAKDRRKSSPSTRKGVIIALSAIVLVVSTLWGLGRAGVINLPLVSDNETATPTDNQSNTGINYGPPTEEEKKAGDQIKDEQNQPTTPPTTPGQKKTVTPVITSWGFNTFTQQVEVTGYVGGVIENGGTCTLTLEKSGQKVTESKTAIADAQTTSCGLMTVTGNRLSPGNWTAMLSYTSSNVEGSSEPRTVEGVQ